MITILIFLFIIVASVILTIKKQRPIFLSLPVFAIIGYVTLEIALVPAPFFETVRFIFSLQ
ncbi:hypothetical protein [Alteribacter populi]|uniref:hypothetical protein n=1 Tax=Alteribacter populi TaxID=2011011 RepID=UPI000BBB2D58|nr:hypothetical protein [Alteribacter populi]